MALFGKGLYLCLLTLCFTSMFMCFNNGIDLEYRKKTKMNINQLVKNRNLFETDLEVQYEDYQDYYTLALGIGSPPNYFAVQIDTTTSVSWVPSVTCDNCNASSKYNSSESSTSLKTNKTFEVNDVDGDVTGFPVFDTVRIDELRAAKFGFVAVEKYSVDFDDHEDGKLGLGYKNEHGDEYSILDVLKKSGVIEKKIYSLSEKNQTHGRLHLGDFPNEFLRNSSEYNFCNLTTSEGIDQDYRDGWICEISHILISEDQTKLKSNFSQALEILDGRIVFDSAYSYVTIPNMFIPLFKDYFFSHKQFNDTCKEVEDDYEISFICQMPHLPKNKLDISFIMSGIAYTLPADLLFEKLYKNEKYFEFLLRFSKKSHNLFVLGHPFMSQFTVVFNGEEKHVGFHGGLVTDYREQWQNWFENEGRMREEQEKYNSIILVASIFGGIVFLLVLFIIIRAAVKRRNLEEHGPLISSQA
jgi:hypothetical protein